MRANILFLTLLLPLTGLSAQPLSLDKAREMALEHNRQIKQNHLSQKDAELRSQSAFYNYFPRFNAEAGYLYRNKEYSLFDSDKFLPIVPWQGIDAENGKLDASIFQNPELAAEYLALNPQTGQPIIDSEGNPVFKSYAWLPQSEGEIGQNHNFRMGVNMSQPIFMGGKIAAGNRIAQHYEQIKNHELQLSVSEVLFRTDELFWQCIALEEKVELAGAYLQMIERLIHDLEDLYSEGIITHNQVLQAKVKYNETQLLKMQAQNGLQLNRMALNQHLGLPFDSALPLDKEFHPDILLIAEDRIEQEALENRPELHILNQALLISSEMAKVQRAGMFPTVGLQAGYLLSNPNPYGGFANEFGGDFTVGVGISIPIYHFGDKRRDVARARIEQERMELQKAEAREMISLQVHQSIFKIEEASVRKDLAMLSLEQAEENLSITQNLFKEGRVATRDVLEAQTHWQNAFSQKIEAKNALKLSFSYLQKNMGSLKTAIY